MSALAAGQRVRMERVTAPVWVQVPLENVTGVVVVDACQNLHGQLVAVKLDPVPAVFARLRELGYVSDDDLTVLVWPDEVEADKGTAESAEDAENARITEGER